MSVHPDQDITDRRKNGKRDFNRNQAFSTKNDLPE
jgi:hypothetical protein